MQNPGIYASQAHLERRVQRLQRAAARAAPAVPQRVLRPDQLHVRRHRRPNSAGTAQNRFEAFLDNARPELEHRPLGVPRDARRQRQRHLRAAVRRGQASGSNQRRPAQRHRRRLAGQRRSSPGRAGRRSRIYSGRGTFNRAGRSNCATATAARSAATRRSRRCRPTRSRSCSGVYEANGNIYWIDPKVIDPATGRAVGADNARQHGGLRGPGLLQPGRGRGRQPRAS